MKNFLSNLITLIQNATKLSLSFLCLGVVVQILIDDKILGWDPVGNIQAAGSAFVGVIALIVLYLLFYKKNNN